MNRVSLNQGNMLTIQIMSKEETLTLLDKFYALESCAQNKHQKLTESMRVLELYTRQEIQTLQREW